MFKMNWNKYYMTELANRAETLKLQTVQGTQDQYAAMFGGLLFMDFRGKTCQRGAYSKRIEEEPYSVVERLDEYAPNLWITVAIPEITREKSDQTNGSLSDRYLDGEKLIVEAIEEMARNGQEGKRAVVNQDLEYLYRIINKDNEFMDLFGMVSEDNKRIIKVGKNAGAVATRVCGAGRGAVALIAKSEDEREAIFQALQGEVEHLYKVEMDEGARYETQV
jgi:galactokinase/mevalonate kinase-like predicted kinase